MNDIDLNLPVFDKMYEIERDLEKTKRGSESRARLVKEHRSIFNALYNTGNMVRYWEYAIDRKSSEKG